MIVTRRFVFSFALCWVFACSTDKSTGPGAGGALSGLWSGTITNLSGQSSVHPYALHLTQAGAGVTGSTTLLSNFSSEVRLTGSVSGDTLNATLISPFCSLPLMLVLQVTADTMRGTWTYAGMDCGGVASGQVDVTRRQPVGKTGYYQLRTVGGATLPVVVESGPSFCVQVLGGSVYLVDGMFRRFTSTQGSGSCSVPSPDSTSNHGAFGTYVLNGSAVQFQLAGADSGGARTHTGTFGGSQLTVSAPYWTYSGGNGLTSRRLSMVYVRE